MTKITRLSQLDLTASYSEEVIQQFISLVAESAIAQPIEKKYTKDDLLKKLSYQGSQTDSQQIDEQIYPGS